MTEDRKLYLAALAYLVGVALAMAAIVVLAHLDPVDDQPRYQRPPPTIYHP